MRIASAFGGGMGMMGDICGAVTGSLMVIGLRHGNADAEGSKVQTYKLAERFVKEFKARHNAIICRELIGFEIGLKKDLNSSSRNIISERCPAYVQTAADILVEII